MSNKGSRGNSLASLQIGRGIAAIAVLWSHAVLFLAEARYLGGVDKVPLHDWMFPGYHGVDYFFVLSGFIISHAHWNDIGSPGALGRYAWRRAIRIFPPYWVITTLLLVLYAIKPDMGRQHDAYSIFTSYLLLPNPESPILAVAWTLRYEMLFYVSFAIFIAFGARVGAIVYPLWMAYILLMAEPVSQVVSLASPHILNFMLGFLACGISKKVMLSKTQASVLAAVGVLMLVVLYSLEALYAPAFLPAPANLIMEWRDKYALSAWGVASAVTILGLTYRDLTNPKVERSALFKLFQLFGDASYSLYLFHVVAVSAVAVAAFKLAPDLMRAMPLLPVALLIVGGLIGGIIFHLMVEKPLLARIPKQPPNLFGRAGAGHEHVLRAPRKDAVPK